MKNFNFKIIFVFILFLTALTQAQDKIWVGPSAGSWGDPDHWSPVGVPSAVNDVIIPPNTWVTVDTNVAMDELSVLKGAIVDKTTASAMTITGGGNFAFTSTFNFEAGSVNAGSGLFFDGEVNIIGPEFKQFAGIVTIHNVINIGTGVFDFNLRTSTLNIVPSATMNTEDGSIDISAFSGTLHNEGTITKLTGSGTFTIDTVFENDGGTINVNAGSMSVTNTSTLTDGQYNVNSAGFLELGGNTVHRVNGTLVGQLNGPFIFNSQFRVENNAENFLDFSGPAGVEWRSNTLSAQSGPGTILVNKGLLEIIDTGGTTTQISGGAVLRNEGNIIIREGLTLNLCSTCILNNNELGTITIEQGVNVGPFGGAFINTGLVEKDLDSGSSIIQRLTNNAPGILNMKVGNIGIPLSYEGDGTISGDGSINTLASLDIAGTITPGDNGIGTLDYNNNSEFDSTEDTIYQIEINGTTPDTEHDVFAINANARLNGTLDVILGFEPELNDEFIIITANAVTECNLPAQVSSIFNDNSYTYDVVCNADNVVLRVSDISLGLDENELANTTFYPNPTSGDLKIEFGQIQSELNTTISNILGQVITNERFVNTDTIDLKIDGSPGIYFVTIDTSDGNQKTFKILKK